MSQEYVTEKANELRYNTMCRGPVKSLEINMINLLAELVLDLQKQITDLKL